MIAALPRNADPESLRSDAIACNAVIDGLWLEGSALPQDFAPGELERIGLASVGAIFWNSSVDGVAAHRSYNMRYARLQSTALPCWAVPMGYPHQGQSPEGRGC